MDYRPFRLLGASEKKVLINALSEAARSWGSEWIGATELKPQWRLFSLSDLTAENRNRVKEWKQVVARADQNSSVHLEAGEGRSQELATWLGNNLDQSAQSQITDLVSQMATQVMEDLLERVGAAIGLESDSGKAGQWNQFEDISDEFRIGSGSMYAELEIEGLRLKWIFINCPVARSARHRVEGQQALSSCDTAIENQKVKVSAWLGQSELTIEDLGNMAVGDVLRLDEKLDGPLILSVAGSVDAVLHGRLCSKNEHRALKLLA